jgi:DNA-binding NarL/FixJ family response regulator
VTDLSPRQRAVLALVATGATNAEIAAALGLSEETIRSHLKRAYEALGCEAGQMNRVQAAVWWTGTTYTTALMALTTRGGER